MSPRLYSLYVREPQQRNWRRIGLYVLPQERAIRHYQDALIYQCYGECHGKGQTLELRPLRKGETV